MNYSSFSSFTVSDFNRWIDVNNYDYVSEYTVEFYKKYFNVIAGFYLPEYIPKNSWRDFIRVLSEETGTDQKALAGWLDEKGIKIIRYSLDILKDTDKTIEILNYYSFRLNCALEDAEEFEDKNSLFLTLIDIPICIKNELGTLGHSFNESLTDTPWKDINYLLLFSEIAMPANEQATTLLGGYIESTSKNIYTRKY
ncbi:hypothetical protein Dtox_3422 [Desulfofarcimen acetoxidans DSM 771]|uniref:Uncharacterized protein n=1 Tax=Desulfofarcimen acetoxidans (strain ATCC 49208 / DSM 771 / KCTC 5769 / VKM B-1644 / 5575) TaxID=485916 RepID=C8W6N6_DESAS|nr:hypothetical protein [Desulfofarcimen acetoxidans]ACV64145.1 hypothetical protein Dtox_3422 [Desulfofarcimen acetoxidans DSM 771]